MVQETCTSDRWLETVNDAARGLELARALDVVARLAKEDFDARLRFVRVLGRRWSYLAGYRSPAPAGEPPEHVLLGGSVGLVVESWGSLPGGVRARLIALLKARVVALETQTPESARHNLGALEPFPSALEAYRRAREQPVPVRSGPT